MLVHEFKGVVNLLDMKAYIWDDTGLPENYEVVDIPEDMVEKANEYREQLIETAVEQDDDLMMAYMDALSKSNYKKNTKITQDNLVKSMKTIVENRAKYNHYKGNDSHASILHG